jgi:hypothetical protein
MTQALTPTRSYSGLRGCMCGCLGKYTEVDQNPEKVYKDMMRILKNPNTKYDEVANCYYYETKTRNNVVYMKDI